MFGMIRFFFVFVKELGLAKIGLISILLITSRMVLRHLVHCWFVIDRCGQLLLLIVFGWRRVFFGVAVLTKIFLALD